MKLGPLFGAFTLAAALAAPAAQAAYQYSAVVSFGDSLSDTGNVLATTAALGGPAVPPAPYFGGRFSNGPVAVEYVAQGLGVALQDYAYGGATSGLFNADFTPADPAELYNTGVLSQIARYAADTGGVADSQALFVVSGGSNDFLAGDLSDPATIYNNVILNLGGAINSLYGMGARHFLLPLLPDLGMTPGAQAAGVADDLSLLIADFNQTLAGVYGSLQGAMPDARFTVLNTYAVQHAIVAGAPANGLSNFTDPCYSGSAIVPGTECADPDAHFFWDAEHPSAAVHELVGARFLAAALPEPATPMLAAAAVLALAWRRRPAPAAARG